jgi:RNA polymerase sigma-70 factor (ECF subfamily)
VLGFSAREVAEALDATPVSIDSALQRAHRTVDQRMPERTQQATLRALEDDALRDTVDRYREAWERADVEAVKQMLAEDAVLAMPPHPTWFAGREAVAEFLRLWPFAPGNRERLMPTRANGQLAFAHYTWDGDRFTPEGISVLALRGKEIADLTIFRTPDLFARFGLPEARE